MFQIEEIMGYKIDEEIYTAENIAPDKAILTLIDDTINKLSGYIRYSYSQVPCKNREAMFYKKYVVDDNFFINSDLKLIDVFPYKIVSYFSNGGIVKVVDINNNAYLMNKNGSLIFKLRKNDQYISFTSNFGIVKRQEFLKNENRLEDIYLILDLKGKIVKKYKWVNQILNDETALVQTLKGEYQIINLITNKLIATSFKRKDIYNKFLALKEQNRKIIFDDFILLKLECETSKDKYLIKYRPVCRDKSKNSFPFKTFIQVIAQKYNIPLTSPDNLDNIKEVIQYFNEQGNYFLDLVSLEVKPLKLVKGIKISDGYQNKVISFDKDDKKFFRIRRKE